MDVVGGCTTCYIHVQSLPDRKDKANKKEETGGVLGARVDDGGVGRLTSIDQCDGVVDCFLRVRLEYLIHIREWRLPFQRVAQIAMRAHCAEEATRLGDAVVEVFADLVGEEG